jgi:hypothetical protein
MASPEDRAVFEAPATVVDDIPAPFRGVRPRPPSTEVAQFEESYEATRESREVAELLAAHEISLARERRALEVEDGQIEADLPAAVEDFDDAVPTLIREPTPAFMLSGPFAARVIELPRPPAPAPPPSLLARVRGLWLPLRVVLVCGWLALVGALGAMLSRHAWRAPAPATLSETPAPPAAPAPAIDPAPAAPVARPAILPRARGATPAAPRSHRPNVR